MIKGPRYYILKDKVPVPCDMLTWARMFEDGVNRRVAFTELAPGVEVSTVFLGLDHNFFGKGPPIVFETMAFDDYGGQDQRRYATWAEAELGHLEMVEEFQARIAGKTPADERTED